MIRAAFLTAAALALTGCAGAAVGGAAVAGVGVSQQRSIGAAIDDNIIALALRARFAGHSEALLRFVGLEVVEGRVLLVGAVASEHDRVAAVAIARTTRGVYQVVDEIQIVGGLGGQSLGQYAVDGRISTQLRARLLGSTGIGLADYSIEVVNRTVYLFGHAASVEQLNWVIHTARTTVGVRRVVSHVLLPGDPRRADPVRTWRP